MVVETALQKSSSVYVSPLTYSQTLSPKYVSSIVCMRTLHQLIHYILAALMAADITAEIAQAIYGGKETWILLRGLHVDCPHSHPP